MAQDNARPPFKLILALVALIALIAKDQPKAEQTSLNETAAQTHVKRPALVRDSTEINAKTPKVQITNWSSL